MSEELKTSTIELQEMARIILCEIYSAKKIQSKLGDFGLFEEERPEGFSFDNGLDGVERRSLAFGDTGGLQRQSGGAVEDGELFPRLSRREFMAQRVQRRIARDNPLFNSGVASTVTESKSIKLSGDLTQADLSEKLSDIFCRDARRYDGGYERY